ncbi:hypothetical protein [Oryzibacter oryziterrae]|uniref:hypothetical protein n=1 Tax=Oryzibacter oryziterrae TaxID=2766474 RepID=UPI001F239802|nr:hypothetical protein [Oryzibacter oryziterrae]
MAFRFVKPHEPQPRTARSDMLASLALPGLVIAFGIAVSLGVSGGFGALADLCLSMVR